MTDNTPVDSDKQKPTTEDLIRAEVQETIQELEPQKENAAPGKDKKPAFTFDQLKKSFYQNEYGDADVTIPLFKNRFVLDNTTGEFYIYRDHRWHPCLNREQDAAFREVADVYGHEAVNCKKRAAEAEKNGDTSTRDKEREWQTNFNERARKLRGKARMKNVLSFATAGDGSLGVSGENWNLNPNELPVANGVVDLETGNLRPGRYDDWFCYGSPIEYRDINYGGKYVPDLISKLLCGDEALIDYFEYLLGFCATGYQTKDFFVAYGPLGDNGKSVIFDWVSYVLGGFASSMPVEMIYEDRFGRDPDKPSPQMLTLRGLRMAIMSEPERNKKLSYAKVKFLTSGTDKLKARSLQEKKLTSFWPSHTLIMHGNEMPKVQGSQTAFYNRCHMIPFRARFVKDDKLVDEKKYIFKMIPRTQVDKSLRPHDSELLSYLVRCAKKALLLGDMPEPPKAVDDETKEYRDNQDIVGLWVNVCTEKVPDNDERAKDVYLSFAYYCDTELGLSSRQIPSQKMLSPDLRSQSHIEHFFDGRTYSYRGFKIKNEWKPDSDWIAKNT
jgi:putative DNA primase/helicase